VAWVPARQGAVNRSAHLPMPGPTALSLPAPPGAGLVGEADRATVDGLGPEAAPPSGSLAEAAFAEPIAAAALVITDCLLQSVVADMRVIVRCQGRLKHGSFTVSRVASVHRVHGAEGERYPQRGE
jgi:hypothetical protein